jgi:hypothetical protein
VHDYQLEELGPRAFEQLVVAVARKTIGPGLQVYGAGPDGGRDATYGGPIDWSSSPINWSNTDGGPGWDGYTVVEAKQCEHPSNSDPAKTSCGSKSSSETNSTPGWRRTARAADSPTTC